MASCRLNYRLNLSVTAQFSPGARFIIFVSVEEKSNQAVVWRTCTVVACAAEPSGESSRTQSTMLFLSGVFYSRSQCPTDMLSDLNDCQTQLSTKELQLFWTAETHSRFGDDVCEDYGGQKHSTNSLETVRTGCSFNRLFMTTASYAFGNLSRVHTMVTKSLSKPAKICRNSLSRLITQDQNGPRHPTYPKSSFSSTFFYYYCLHFCE